MPEKGDPYPRQALPGAREKHEAFASVRYAQAVFMVVSNSGAARRRDAGKRFLQIGRGKRFARRIRMDRLAVLGANPVGDQRHMGKGDDLCEHKQAAKGRTSPSPRVHGSCGESKRGPKHDLVLTPRQNEVKVGRPERRLDDPARVDYRQ